MNIEKFTKYFVLQPGSKRGTRVSSKLHLIIWRLTNLVSIYMTGCSEQGGHSSGPARPDFFQPESSWPDLFEPRWLRARSRSPQPENRASPIGLQAARPKCPHEAQNIFSNFIHYFPKKYIKFWSLWFFLQVKMKLQKFRLCIINQIIKVLRFFLYLVIRNYAIYN